MTSPQDLAAVACIGVGATAVMDAWLALLRRLRVPVPDFALVGRWVGAMAQGRLVHASIAKSPPVRAERAIGWATHYAVGIAFAALLVALVGVDWLSAPTLVPALAVGVGTVVAPLFVMQPAMGAGFAASRTAAPLRNCLRSIGNHAAFGVGLYVAAVALRAVRP
jgi:hypothetical protein